MAAPAMALRLLLSALLLCFCSGELPKLEQPAKPDGSLAVLVVGDWGRKGLYNQSQVAAQMGRIGEELDIDFVISTGDNFYEDGLKGVDDTAFEMSFSNIYTARSLQKQWYSEIVEFFFVDTTPFVLHYWTNPKEHKYDWRDVAPRSKYVDDLLKDLDSALKKSPAKWKFVVGHHTLRSVSSHGDTEELMELLLPLLKENEVDLYINGHDHCLEHISSKDSPIQFLTSGGGSKAWRGVQIPNEDKLRFFYDGQGFMTLELTSSYVKFTFYDIDGRMLHHWTLTKETHPFA